MSFVRSLLRVASATAALGCALVGAIAAPQPPNSVLVTVGLNGAPSDAVATAPSLSYNGRFVAFQSDGSDLVDGDFNRVDDIFVRDLSAERTVRASAAFAGLDSNGPSRAPSLSADGQTVAFESLASNLVLGDTGGLQDIFVHHLTTQRTERVSQSVDGRSPNGASRDAAISADGRFVAFESDASNLTSGDRNGRTDVFVYDRLTRRTDRVSVATGGAEALGSSRAPAISGDGRYIAFESDADNLVPGDTNRTTDVFIHDRQTGRTSAASVSRDAIASMGAVREGAVAGYLLGNRASRAPAISADGMTVAFQSDSTNLVLSDTNGATDVFVRNLADATTSLVSRSSLGRQATGASMGPAISADGRCVLFETDSDNLAPLMRSMSVFMHDRSTGQTARLAELTEVGDVPAFMPAAMSGDGATYGFTDKTVDGPLGIIGSPGQRIFVGGACTSDPVCNIVPGGPIAVSPGMPIQFTVSGMTACAEETLTLEGAGVPAGASFNPPLPVNGGASISTDFSWTPVADDEGDYIVSFTISDSNGRVGQCQIDLSVLACADAPTLDITNPGPITLAPGDMISFTTTAASVCPGARLTLTTVGLPASASQVPVNQTGVPDQDVSTVFSWQPTAFDLGLYTVTYTAADQTGRQVQRSVMIEVTQCPVPPSCDINPPGPLAPRPGDAVQFTVSAATDCFGSELTLSAVGAPPGGVFNPPLPMTVQPGEIATTTFTWTPTADDALILYNVTFTAEDTTGVESTCSIDLDVGRCPNPPSIQVNPPGPFTIAPGQTLNFDVTGLSDCLDASLQLLSTPLPPGATLSPPAPVNGAPNAPVGSSFSWTPNATHFGSRTVTFTVRDSTGRQVQLPVVINVGPCPNPPVCQIDPPGPFVVNPGEVVQFTVTGTTDCAGSGLLFEEALIPSTAMLNPALPIMGSVGDMVATTFTWTPLAADAGMRSAIFTLTDATGRQTVCEVPITVNQCPDAPTCSIDPTGVINVTPGDLVQFSITSQTQCPGGAVTIQAANVPSGATINPPVPATGLPEEPVSLTFSWIPTASQVGTRVVTFTTTDSSGRQNQCSKTIVVGPCATPPTCVFDPAGPYTVAPGGTLQFNVSALNECLGSIVTLEVLGSLPAGASMTAPLPISGAANADVSSMFSWSPMASQQGSHAVTFRVRDNTGRSQTCVANITVEACPEPPTCLIDPPGPFTVSPGQPVNFSVSSATDCPGAFLTLQQSGAPAGSQFTPTLPLIGDPNEAVASAFSWTPDADDMGEHTVMFTVTDSTGEQSQCAVSITVGPCDMPPVCSIDPAGPLSVAAGDLVALSLGASTACPAASLTFSLVSAPEGVEITPGLPIMGGADEDLSAMLSWTPTAKQLGEHVITFEVADSTGQTSQCSITITVGPCAALPVCSIDPPGPFNVAPGEAVAFMVGGMSDCPGASLTLEAAGAPNGAMVTPNLPKQGDQDGPVSTTFSWTPGAADGGSYTVVFTVTDSTGQSSQCSADINVGACPEPPTCIIDAPATINAAPGDAVEFDVFAATECLGASLTLEALVLPSGAVMTPALPINGGADADLASHFSWTPTAQDQGVATATFRVVDSTGLDSTCSVTINVGPCAAPPVCAISAGDTITAAPGEAISFTIDAMSDCSGAALTLAHGALPGGASVTPPLPVQGGPDENLQATFNWTPGAGDQGSYEVVFTVTDSTGESSMCSTTINVGPCADPPTCMVSVPSPILVAPGAPVQFTITGDSDCLGAALTLAAANVPAGAMLSPAAPVMGGADESVASVFTWTPSADDQGDHTVNFTITDSTGRESMCSVTISVGACANPPLCLLSEQSVEASPGEMVSFTITGSTDCDGAALTLDAAGLPPGATLTPPAPVNGAPDANVLATFNWTPTADDVGDYMVTFTITDSTGRSSQCVMPIAIGPCPAPPVCAIDGPTELNVSPGDLVTFEVSASTDCPAAALTLAAVGTPSGASFLPALPLGGAPDEDIMSTFSWSPKASDLGTYDIDFTVTDSTGVTSNCSVRINVGACPVSPVCQIDPPGPITVAPGEKAAFTISATSECDGASLTLDSGPMPAGSMISPNLPDSGGEDEDLSATFTWIPVADDQGSHTINFTIEDSTGRQTQCSVEVIVGVCATPPLCAIDMPETVKVSPGEEISFSVSASTECPGASLRLEAMGAPVGSTFTPTLPAEGGADEDLSSVFAWTPTADDQGMHTVTFTVTDSTQQTSMCSIEIIVGPCPEPPTCIIDPPGPISVAPGEKVSFSVTADSDCPRVGLTLATDGLPEGAMADGVFPIMNEPGGDITTSVTWTPSADDQGDHDINFTVTDSTGRTSMCAVRVTVGPCATPPACTFDNPGPFLVAPGESVNFTVTGSTDCPGAALTLSSSGAPSTATINPALPITGAADADVSATFDWTPKAGDVGVYNVNFTVEDSTGESSQCSVEIRVGPCAEPPVCSITPPGPLSVSPGDLVVLQIGASTGCPEASLTLTSGTLPDGAIVVGGLPVVGDPDEDLSATFEWSPTAQQLGEHTITFFVNDSTGGSNSCTVTITVGPCAEPPLCTIDPPGPISAAPGEAVVFTVTGSTDCPGAFLTLDAGALPEGSEILEPLPVIGGIGENVSATFIWTPDASALGDHVVAFTITDSTGVATQCSVTITVTPCPEAPQCQTVPDGPFAASPGEPIGFTLRAPTNCLGAAVTIEAVSVPAGMTFSPGLPFTSEPGETAEVNVLWTPTALNVGPNTATFLLRDSTGRETTCQVDISVGACPNPPICFLTPIGPLAVEPFEPVSVTIEGLTDCPAAALTLTVAGLPFGATIDPPAPVVGAPDADIEAEFTWLPTASDIGSHTVTFTITDSTGRTTQCELEIEVLTVCREFEPNNDCERPNIIDSDECEYIVGCLDMGEDEDCSPDTFLVLFNKDGQMINSNDNSSPVGDGRASAILNAGNYPGSNPAIIANGDGSKSVRIGVTGRADGLDGNFNGFFQNAPHGQRGGFSVTVSFKNSAGALIQPAMLIDGTIIANPIVYSDAFITGAEAFHINYNVPLGTAKVDVVVDNTAGRTPSCADVDEFRIINLVPLCDYCFIQVGGLAKDCTPTDLLLGWRDKGCVLIDTDEDSGAAPGFATLCAIADVNGVINLAVTGRGDTNFNGRLDDQHRAPEECADDPPGHGVCGCYTIRIVPISPHGGATASRAAGATVEQLDDALIRGDLNMDGVTDTADLGMLLGSFLSGGQR